MSNTEIDDLIEIEDQKTVSRGSGHSRKFYLKHVFRAGAIVWLKHKGKDYYAVFKSYSRPNRGTQLPGGRVERKENPAQGVVREVAEETGIDSKIVCPLGTVYFENPEDNYSNLQIYYILRPTKPLNVFKKWKFIDKDASKQELECWFVPIDKDPSFLAAGQDEVVHMFRKWLDEHKPKSDYSYNKNTTKKPVKKFKPKTEKLEIPDFNPSGKF